MSSRIIVERKQNLRVFLNRKAFMASVEGCSLALSSMEGSRTEVDLAALVEAYSSLLFRVAHSVLRSGAEAEDVVQDVFVRVLEHRGSLPVIRDMRVWLVRIAWNLAIDRRRRIRPEQFDEGFAEGLVARDLPTDEALHEARRMRAVLQELERLPKAERNVLLLSAVEELGTAEMAEVLGRSESAVRALLFRARARLKERLEKGGGER
jgi:RNA polymerase sigma-70 factor (ECF subfamily)